MLGKRKHFRVKGSYEVSFGIEGHPEIRNGIVSNISMNGMEMVTRDEFPAPSSGSVFFIEPVTLEEIIPLQSKQAQMKWVKSFSKEDGKYLQFGLEFVKESKVQRLNDTHNAINISEKVKKQPDPATPPPTTKNTSGGLISEFEDIEKELES
jgi:hypothetical protein